MLKITVPAEKEYFDSSTNEFIKISGGVLLLEHSLLSVAKWESKWNKPFLSNRDKTMEEAVDYIRCMTVNEVDETIYLNLSDAVIQQIIDYINEPMTATTFTDSEGGKKNKEVITNEIIYYWMFSLGISKECENWHLARLLTLIRVCSEKNNPDKKKMSKREIYSRNRAINEARRKQFNTRG